jgi:hypothetical protein
MPPASRRGVTSASPCVPAPSAAGPRHASGRPSAAPPTGAAVTRTPPRRPSNAASCSRLTPTIPVRPTPAADHPDRPGGGSPPHLPGALDHQVPRTRPWEGCSRRQAARSQAPAAPPGRLGISAQIGALGSTDPQVSGARTWNGDDHGPSQVSQGHRRCYPPSSARVPGMPARGYPLSSPVFSVDKANYPLSPDPPSRMAVEGRG